MVGLLLLLTSMGASLPKEEVRRTSSDKKKLTRTPLAMEAPHQPEVSKPAVVSLPPNLYRTLHLGKAGGGTVKQRFKKIWRLDATQCHPSPCFSNTTTTTTTDTPLVFVTLRDPVDRFVSAFYWRIFRLCEESGLSVGDCARPPKTAQHQELVKLLFDRYEKNASRLAEDLCSTDAEAAAVARKAVQQIPHAQYSIHDWMAYAWQPEQVYPLVMEAGAQELEEQFDSAVSWLYEAQPFESADAFRNRQAYVVAHTFPSTNRHSSKDNKQVLSLAAEACLEEYYRPDYELLRTLAATTCKSDDCRHAVQLILDRRSGAWKESTGL
jgi:hypothetical protein